MDADAGGDERRAADRRDGERRKRRTASSPSRARWPRPRRRAARGRSTPSRHETVAEHAVAHEDHDAGLPEEEGVRARPQPHAEGAPLGEAERAKGDAAAGAAAAAAAATGATQWRGAVRAGRKWAGEPEVAARTCGDLDRPPSVMNESAGLCTAGRGTPPAPPPAESDRRNNRYPHRSRRAVARPSASRLPSAAKVRRAPPSATAAVGAGDFQHRAGRAGSAQARLVGQAPLRAATRAVASDEIRLGRARRRRRRSTVAREGRHRRDLALRVLFNTPARAAIPSWSCTAAATRRSRRGSSTSWARTTEVLCVKGSGWDMGSDRAGRDARGAACDRCCKLRARDAMTRRGDGARAARQPDRSAGA